jgi:hypothetical protein
MMAALSGLRSTLIENSNACAPPDDGKLHLEDVLLFYAPGSRQVIIALDGVSTVPREVSLYAMDGRMLYQSEWSEGSVFWLNTEGFPAGVYVVRLEAGGESVAQKVVVN